MIDSYDFGWIIIKGKKYTRDVIVFPERVRDGWWRKKGHGLCVEDLGENSFTNQNPKFLLLAKAILDL